MHFRILLPAALAVLLAACGSCGSNDEAIALARGLSQERLAQLFRDVQTLNPAADQFRTYVDTRTGIPDAFHDLYPRSIANDGQTARIHLSGCVDDKVMLIVNGIEDGGKNVTLLPGEAKDPVVLWKSN